MKRFLYSLGIIVALAGAIIIGAHQIRVQAQPGGADDPLVTRSYVEARHNELLQLIFARDAANVNTDAIVAAVLNELGFAANQPSETFIPVFLPAGQTLHGNEGSEIILRSGAAVGNAPGENGIVNITTGHEIFHNDSVVINNLLIIPRTDGRGVTATQDAWLIVRGGFQIIPQ